MTYENNNIYSYGSLLLIGCNSTPAAKMGENKTTESCSDNCQAKNKSTELSCKLSTPELKQRKATVLANLRKQVIEKKELANGYAFKFSGSDKTVDELIEFIKTERECCDFFYL